MNFDELLADNVEIFHPWTPHPHTIGSVATMYLSLFFMREF